MTAAGTELSRRFDRLDLRMLDTLAGRVLLAEDCLDNQRLIASLLRRWGLTVAVAGDGRQAVDAALASREVGEPFDLILMDMQMPVLDGYEATRELRRRGWTGPIHALTANAMFGDQKFCLDAGCTGYARKPIERTALHALLAESLSRRSADVTIEPSRGRESSAESATAFSANSTGTPGVYSRSVALERTGGDQALCDEILGLVLSEGVQWLGLIREFVAAENFKQARRVAHSAKSSADNIGALRAREAFWNIERAAIEADAPATAAALEQAVAPLEELLDALRCRG